MKTEWKPTTDFSIANALLHDNNDRIGKRCSYIYEDETNDGNTGSRSLSVEELAIEEYSAGKLPDAGCSLKGGGWKGWHSEGVHVRVLFRILVTDSLLRYDYNCNEFHPSNQLSLEQITVFLTPYQSCPLDLHVGHCLLQSSITPEPIRSFYERRKRNIEEYLNRIKSLSPQDLSNLVHESIMKRKQTMIDKGKAWDKDEQLIRDLKEIRTLSLLAACFGGELLSAMFRCLLFDYRQYCGGMPDVTLVRAGWDSNNIGKFSNWDEWIGEGFMRDHDRNIKALLYDRDDDFLGGCFNETKTSISSARDRVSFKESNNDELCDNINPLELSYDGKQLILQSMFVEVKSANDTLDERQEDWLNIIGSYGEARVCKFESSKNKKK